MKILVLNCGSSSLKYQLIDMETKCVLAKGNYERIGEEEAFLTHKVENEKLVINQGVKSHDEALKQIISCLLNPQFSTISSLSEISGVGHRVAHGGEIFKESVIITDKVLEDIEALGALAPLHNPAAALGIKACRELMPNTPMVATFDTAFHQTMKKQTYMYPIPKEYYERYGIRKYGFHGTSHRYVAYRLAEILNKPICELKIVTCHLGQGASIAAIDRGMCIDTSMGLTPLGGIPMVTRSGDMDPSVVTYIMDKEGLTPKEMETILNKKSGLSGMTELSPDFRYIESLASENEDAELAVDVFTTKVAEYIARYAAKMRGIDAVIFTGGIGENQISVREKVCDHLGFIGLEIDAELNNVKSEEKCITKSNSKVLAYVIPTDEEYMIAKDTLEEINVKG